MARLIEMMRESAVPAGVMRSAARGALTVPAAEMLEILVFLAGHPAFGEQARNTLAAFDEAGSIAALSNPETPREVLNYFLSPWNRSPKLLLPLTNNPSIPEQTLAAVAETASRETAEILLASDRVMRSGTVLKLLLNNSNLPDQARAHVAARLTELGIDAAQELGTVFDVEVSGWLKQHAAELAAEEQEDKPFVLLGGLEEELDAEQGAEITAEALEAAKDKVDEQRLSTLQKLARLKVGERIKVAMLGTKEERNILIRDSSKLVSLAVLASPKVSEAEMEGFANMKNVREHVLRGIARNPKYKKNIVVLRNLCNNPRTPLDLSLGLMKNLMTPDLRFLSVNKNVPETLRKMASRMFEMRMTGKG
jgi:hypothetical protein